MDETPISRGFRSRRQEQTLQSRVPPGQYVTTDFPVLSAGPTPQVRVVNWTLALQLGGSLVGKWSWAEFEALPQTTIKTDIHCLTKWSKLDTTWQGGGARSHPHPTSWLIATEDTQQTSRSRTLLAPRA
jgi:DMSO/TMAO reductase YedYZ molybdopterin-dependent catalytic subunit